MPHDNADFNSNDNNFKAGSKKANKGRIRNCD